MSNKKPTTVKKALIDLYLSLKPQEEEKVYYSSNSFYSQYLPQN